MKEKQTLTVNFSSTQLDQLAAIKERTGATRTKNIRGLIPREQMLIALEEKQFRLGQDCLCRPGGIYDVVALMLADKMKNDGEHPIPLQVKSRQQAHEMAHNLSILYSHWAKAKRGADGFRFERISHTQDGAELSFWIVCHEDDPNKEHLIDEILELAGDAIKSRI